MNSCENLDVEIIEQPINVFLGCDTFSSNLTCENFNVKLLQETINAYKFDEVFNSNINGFVGSGDLSVFISYFIVNEIPNGIKDNINKIFKLAFIPLVGKAVVYLNGLLQAPNLDYTIIDDTITFIKAPKVNHDIYVSYIRSN